MRPRSLRLTNRSPPMTTWSSSSMPSSLAACASSLVMAASSGLGVGSWLGWLWLMMTAGDGFDDGGAQHLGGPDDGRRYVPLVDHPLAHDVVLGVQ